MLTKPDSNATRTAGADMAGLNIIGGESRPARSGATIDVACPSDGAVFATIARSEEADVEAAVCAARAAFLPAGRVTAELVALPLFAAPLS